MNKGHHILLCARSSDKGHTAIKDLESRNLSGSAEFVHLDVTDDVTIERAAKQIEKKHGKLDWLVNNA